MSLDRYKSISLVQLLILLNNNKDFTKEDIQSLIRREGFETLDGVLNLILFDLEHKLNEIKTLQIQNSELSIYIRNLNTDRR